jgi:hypothetical protein
MKTKILISVMIFLVAGVLAVTAWRSMPNNQLSTLRVASSSANTAFQNEQSSDIPSSSVQETSLNASANLKVTNGGLTAEIREYDLNPDYPTITICTDLPSAADWLPIFSASFNGKTVNVWQVMLIDPEGTAPEKKNRCYLAMLGEGIFQPNQSGTLNFNLEHFQMSIPEILPVDLIAKAKKNLKDKGLDIDFEMTNVDHGQGIVIKKKPTTYTNEQTYQAIQEAIAQSPERVQGPWVFVIDVK